MTIKTMTSMVKITFYHYDDSERETLHLLNELPLKGSALPTEMREKMLH